MRGNASKFLRWVPAIYIKRLIARITTKQKSKDSRTLHTGQRSAAPREVDGMGSVTVDMQEMDEVAAVEKVCQLCYASRLSQDYQPHTHYRKTMK